MAGRLSPHQGAFPICSAQFHIATIAATLRANPPLTAFAAPFAKGGRRALRGGGFFQPACILKVTSLGQMGMHPLTIASSFPA
jgi:hypothetical protein